MKRSMIDRLSVLKSRLQKSRRRHRRRFGGHCRPLSVESLEDRRMLSAVGGFEKTSGIFSAGGLHQVHANGVSKVSPATGAGTPDLIVFADATRVQVDTAAAEAETYLTGRSSATIGESTSTPEIIGNGFVYSHSTALNPGDDAYSYDSGSTWGLAGYQYDAEQGFTENLWFHGHLAIAAGMERIVLGTDGYATEESASVIASIPGYGTLTAAGQGVTWDWSQDLPGENEDFTGVSQGAISRHVKFSIPIADGFNVDFAMTVAAVPSTAVLGDPAADAKQFTVGAAAAWGYVTVGEEDVTDGDFNYDGFVDGFDFELWKEGSFQADANLDGVVDDADLLIWAQNTDELVVTSESDGIDGNYTWGNLTLREAIALAADSVSHPGHDSIFFAPHVDEIVLSGSPLSFGTANPFTIRGLGADRLAINGNQAVSNVFSVSYAQNFTVTIKDIELRGATQYAISVYLGPTLNLDGVEITANGAGVLYSYTSGLTISNSTIAENNGTGVNITYGGGSLYNTTISGNQTTGPTTAGVLVTFAYATLTNVTVTNNRSDKNKTTGTSTGIGGVYAGGAGTLELHNTIVVGNFAGAVSNSIAADIGRASAGYYLGTFHSSSSYNLIGSSPSGAFPTGNNNQIGVTAASVGLLALADNGGKTRTHALSEGSIAIDAGDNAKAIALGLLYDQRGRNYSRVFDGDFDEIETIDMGAFEFRLVT